MALFGAPPCASVEGNGMKSKTHASRHITAASLISALALALCVTFLPACGGSTPATGSTQQGLALENVQADQSNAASDAEADNSSASDTAADLQTDSVATDPAERKALAEAEATVTEDGTYNSKEEVAADIHLCGRLPPNFISKTKARNAGWESSEGNLDEVLPGYSIGGSKYWNDDGALPEESGRSWTECDINYQGGYRGSERIIFSNDGLVYYTSDHYETFEQLY